LVRLERAKSQIANSGTEAGTTSSAWVLAITARDVDTRCHFRQGGLLLSEIFRDFMFDMDQAFRKIAIRPPTLLARQNDRMAVHVCSSHETDLRGRRTDVGCRG